jgi:hypothetical protein
VVVFLTVSAEVGSIYLSDFQNVKLYFVFITSTYNAGVLGDQCPFYTRGHSVKQKQVSPFVLFSVQSGQKVLLGIMPL